MSQPRRRHRFSLLHHTAQGFIFGDDPLDLHGRGVHASARQRVWR
jgi:hypothetical protein